MNKAAAAAALLIAPLVASVVWLINLIVRSKLVFGDKDNLALTFSGMLSDPGGVSSLILTGWMIGLIITCFIGLPLGFLTAFLLGKRRLEGGWVFAVVGTLEGALTVIIWFAIEYAVEGYAQSWTVFSFWEFGPSGAVAGLIMGLGYWRFIRKPLVMRAT